MELLDSRRLRHFLAVYDLRSIGQAAEKLFLTQPALSKSLRQLEEDLQVKLFDRTPLGVVPTVFGEALAQRAKVIRAEMRHAESELANLRGAAKGQVTIGVGPSIAATLMPIATQRFYQERPGIAVTVIEGLVDTLMPALRRGELELAIGAWPPARDADLATERIFRDRVSVVAGSKHPLLRHKSLRLVQLLDHPWVLPPETQRWRHLMEETFLAAGLSPPQPAVTSNSASFIRTLLQENQFLSFLPMQLLSRPREPERLRAVEVEGLSREVDVTVTYRERAILSPAAHALLATLREVAIPR
ncbi:MAG: LysR family transcriptional regulator [Gammaproteobacteria bacterium]|nr:LysR family transcriptional regulator [Gammaproteobacteria bacterium]